ncbi:MAG: hypothetical protein HY064_04380 [Bacteroidetes bacterium]|nr:hypothetical protein [Bacteroidota bacterium]
MDEEPPLTELKNLLAYFFIFFLCSEVHAQNDTTRIVFKGRVYDVMDSSLKLMPIVVNHRTGSGQNAAAGGEFRIGGLKSDTFVISSGGYNPVRICFRDSVMRNEYSERIGLKMKANVMNSVVIYPAKDLSEIQKEREHIGAVQTRTTSGVTDAVESPITYLYERYSREGRSKEAVAMLENEDNKRDILKELFRTYNKSGVIDLQENEFDNFIDFINIPESFLKTASEYDLAVFIRQKFLQYRAAQNFHLHNQR